MQRYDFQWRRDRYVTTPGRPRRSRSISPSTPSKAATWWCSGRAPWPGPRNRSSRACRAVTYFLLRKVAEGAFLMLPVTEDDVDEATRKRFCIKSPERPAASRRPSSCSSSRARQPRKRTRAGSPCRGPRRETRKEAVGQAPMIVRGSTFDIGIAASITMRAASGRSMVSRPVSICHCAAAATS